ncbi:hypothetical protein THF5G08_70135 [Vibrio jasicida]|nr:hypothetical protein THF5G08_70135 [Vibrio jasicida]
MRFGIGWLMSMLIVNEVTLLQHVMLVFNYLNSVFISSTSTFYPFMWSFERLVYLR